MYKNIKMIVNHHLSHQKTRCMNQMKKIKYVKQIIIVSLFDSISDGGLLIDDNYMKKTKDIQSKYAILLCALLFYFKF